MLRLACALALLATADARAATAPHVAGFTHIRSVGDIDEYSLDTNGLRVLIKTDGTAPIATFQLTYHVGSRNEVTGTTGATHILEHMMFKGSARFNDAAGNSIKQYVERVGGINDATASIDRTTYFATLERDSIEGYIAIEADRMRNIWLRDTDRQPEMTVVRNEYERGENDSTVALAKQVRAAAYVAHPYHHPTIGWRSDIENVSTDRLKEFYDTYYWPNNATAILVGGLDTAQALALVRKHFGAIPRSPQDIPQVYTEEPLQTGPRRVTVKRTGGLGSVMIAYKAPRGLDPQLPALNLLGSILSAGANSRYSKALIDTSVATEVTADIRPSRDPGLFTVLARLAPEATHEQVERMLLEEIDKVRKHGVEQEELSRALARYRAEEAYRRDGTAKVAFALNEWAAVGDWSQFVTYIDAMAEVRPEDVQRVANALLDENQSTTGWFVPVSE